MSELVLPAFEILIDPRIDRDEQLREAVVTATDYFIEQYEPRTPTDPPTPPTIAWKVVPGAPSPLKVVVTEHDALSYREVMATYSRGDLQRLPDRNVHMLQLWGKLLDLRSAKRISIIEQLLREGREQAQEERDGN